MFAFLVSKSSFDCKQFVSSLLFSAIHWTGKRPLTLISTVGCGLCFFLTATYAFFLPSVPGQGVNNVVSNVSGIDVSAKVLAPFLNASNDEYLQSNSSQFDGTGNLFIPLTDEEESNQLAWIPLTLLLGSALLSHAGIRLLPWILIGEVFPSNVRAAGAGFASGMGYIGGFLANKFFLSMISSMTLQGTFWFYSSISFIGAVFLYFVLPETEGRTLLEIEDHFTGKRSLDASKNDRTKKISTTSTVPSKKVSKVKPPEFHLDVEKWDANQKFEQQLQKNNFNPREVLNEHKKGNLLITVPSGALIGSKKSTKGGADNPAFEPERKEITHL